MVHKTSYKCSLSLYTYVQPKSKSVDCSFDVHIYCMYIRKSVSLRFSDTKLTQVSTTLLRQGKSLWLLIICYLQ